jgi:hypothetical protein
MLAWRCGISPLAETPSSDARCVGMSATEGLPKYQIYFLSRDGETYRMLELDCATPPVAATFDGLDGRSLRRRRGSTAASGDPAGTGGASGCAGAGDTRVAA